MKVALRTEGGGLSRARLLEVRSVLACVLVVFASGNPLVSSLLPAEILWPALIAVFGILSLDKPLTYRRGALVVIGVFLALAVTHCIMFGEQVLAASIGFVAMLIVALLASHLIDQFPRRFIDVMAVISAVSLAFYIPRALGILGPENFVWLPGAQLENGWVHAWLFNFQKPEESYRNSGMFWEPGAFAGYIVIALLLSAFASGRVKRWKLSVLLISLATTMSTTGFIASVPLSFLVLYKPGKKVPPLYVALICGIAVVLASVFIFAYRNVPFLAEKIDHQSSAVSARSVGYEITRFGSVVYDLDFIKERPVLGWSASPATRQSVDPEFLNITPGQGNGFSSFVAKFGIPALFFYLWRIFVSLGGLIRQRLYRAFGVGTVMLLLFGEQFLNFPVFWCLAMMASDKAMSAKWSASPQ